MIIITVGVTSRGPRDRAKQSLMCYFIETSQQHLMEVLTLFPFFPGQETNKLPMLVRGRALDRTQVWSASKVHDHRLCATMFSCVNE